MIYVLKEILSRQLKVLKRNTLKIYFLVNVNSTHNKFASIQELIKRTFDIFLISGTNVDGGA